MSSPTKALPKLVTLYQSALHSSSYKDPFSFRFSIFFSCMYFFLQWAEFIFFSCLMLVVCLIFSIMGYYYVPLKPGDVQGSADKQTPQIQGNMINLETKKTKV